MQAVGSSTDAAVSQLWGSIPPEGQAVALQVLELANAALGQILERPTQASIVAALVLLPTISASYGARSALKDSLFVCLCELAVLSPNPENTRYRMPPIKLKTSSYLAACQSWATVIWFYTHWMTWVIAI